MEAHLDALVASELQAPVEYLFAIESSDDPALEICQAVMKRHPEKDIHLVLTGPAQGRMGKQHNLAVAVEQARYDAIGSMDADVLVEPDTVLLFGLQSFALLIGVILFITALATRWSSAIVLNRRVYSLAGTTGLAWLVIYELVAVPLLFLKGAFQQQIAWRGRRYRLGRHGRIKHVTDL